MGCELVGGWILDGGIRRGRAGGGGGTGHIEARRPAASLMERRGLSFGRYRGPCRGEPDSQTLGRGAGWRTRRNAAVGFASSRSNTLASTTPGLTSEIATSRGLEEQHFRFPARLPCPAG